MFFEYDYSELVSDVLTFGEEVEDRTGVGTLSLFGKQINIDLTQGFPALTLKKLPFNGVVSELLWFLEGSTDERRLAEIRYGDSRYNLIDKRTIWTDNADNQGVALGYENSDVVKHLGPIYGSQWRNWGGYKRWDQICNLIEDIKTNPHSRRHIVSAWNVNDIDDMALPPCHTMFQFHVDSRKRLSCHLYQRSVDLFLGAPYNYASYALLTHMIAQVCGLGVNRLIVSYGDVHLYKNHLEQANTLLSRKPSSSPTLWLNPDIRDIDDFTMSDIRLEDYNPLPFLAAPMAV